MDLVDESLGNGFLFRGAALVLLEVAQAGLGISPRTEKKAGALLGWRAFPLIHSDSWQDRFGKIRQEGTSRFAQEIHAKLDGEQSRSSASAP